MIKDKIKERSPVIKDAILIPTVAVVNVDSV